ncbi:hypothetical protein Q7P37_010910 [Cladosporium fusiforme]
MVGRCSKRRRRRTTNNTEHADNVTSRDQRSPSLRLPTPAASSGDPPEHVEVDSNSGGGDTTTHSGTSAQTPAGDTIANDLTFFDPDPFASPPSLGMWQLDQDINSGTISCNDTVNFEELENYLGLTRNKDVAPGASNNDGSLIPANHDSASMMNFFCNSPMNTISPAAAPINPQPTSQADEQCGSSSVASDDPFHALHVVFQHIILLETQLREAKRPVDESMHAAKKCIQQLRGVIQLDSYERCNVCPNMMLAAADLIVLLYENIVPRLAPGGETMLQACTAQEASSGGQNSADFRLGKFEADPEDAANVWRYLARGELKRMSSLVEAITARRQGRDGAQANSKTTASYRSLSASLLQRISSLLDKVNEHL